MCALEVRRAGARDVDGILHLLAPWQSRAFFERYFTLDPAFRPDHVCAAFDGDRPVSCAQIIPKTIRVVGGTASVAGVGQVWTAPAYRRQGLAPEVLRRCLDVMREERFALSLLFAGRLDFYGALGWHPYTRARTVVVGWPRAAPDRRIRPFDSRRDLEAVRALYDVYTERIPGVTVRDRRAWQGSLRAAGFPDETFLVATDDGDRPVAYMRGTVDEGTYVAMEYAYVAGQRAAVASLLADHGARAGTGTLVLIDLAHDPPLARVLRDTGFALNTVEDPYVMWRIIDQSALPGSGASIHTPADELAQLERLLPRARYTYWHADRF